MTPLPAPLGTSPVVIWRVDKEAYASTWDSGIGAAAEGGRWNSKGVNAVYCSIDPATAIVEVAVHKGFDTLDTIEHVLTGAEMFDVSNVHIVFPKDIPNPNWLRPAPPSRGQQAFGDSLLKTYNFLIIPSAVSVHSWNILFTPRLAGGCYTKVHQERLALDTRLNAPSR